MRPVLLLACAVVAGAQSIQFETFPREIIERRLKLATPANAERCERLRVLFRAAGCDVVEQPVTKKGQPNLICTLRGETDRAIIVGAHFDANSPGVADNWSGAALLPTFFESLKARPRRHTFVFVGFTDEEKGLLGSKRYVKLMSKEERARTVAVINLDTLGLAPLKVWVTRSDKTLMGWLQTAAAHSKLEVEGVVMDKVGTTDSESFIETKIPRITVSSITQETLALLHTPKDDFAAIKMDAYFDTYRVLALYLALLDVKLGATQ